MVGDDISFLGSNATLTNNLTGNFELDGATTGVGENGYIQYNFGGGNRFINNETVNISDTDGGIFIGTGGNYVDNYGTMYLDVINFNGNTFYLDNYGTINQGSDFLNSASVEELNNHNNATWNS